MRTPSRCTRHQICSTRQPQALPRSDRAQNGESVGNRRTVELHPRKVTSLCSWVPLCNRYGASAQCGKRVALVLMSGLQRMVRGRSEVWWLAARSIALWVEARRRRYRWATSPLVFDSVAPSGASPLLEFRIYQGWSRAHIDRGLRSSSTFTWYAQVVHGFCT